MCKTTGGQFCAYLMYACVCTHWCLPLRLHRLQPVRFLHPRHSPGKNTGAGGLPCPPLGIFLTQGRNLSPAPSALADGFFITEPQGKHHVLYIFLRSCYLHKLEWWSSKECVSLWGMNVFCKEENPQEAAKPTSFLESHPVLLCGLPAHEYWCDCKTQAHISLQTEGRCTNHYCEATVMKRHSLVKCWDWMKWKSEGRQELCQARFVSFCQWLVVRARGAPFRWTNSPSSLHAQSSDHRPVQAAKSLRGRGKLVGRGAGKDAPFSPAALCADMPASAARIDGAPHTLMRKSLPPTQETWLQPRPLGREDPPGGGHGSPLQYSC